MAADQNQEFFVKTGEGEFGPFTSSELKDMAKERRITAKSYIRDGSGSWISAGKVKGLVRYFAEQFGDSPVSTAVEVRQRHERSNGETQVMIACPFCAEMIQAAAKKCRHCGEIVDPALNEVRSLRQQIQVTGARSQGSLEPSEKSVTTAALLCFFLGEFGGHRFYVGKTGSAVAMLLLSLTLMGLVATIPWKFVDLVMILTKKFKDDRDVTLTEWS